MFRVNTTGSNRLQEFRFDQKVIHQDLLKPIKSKWKVIQAMLMAKDTQGWGVIHQN